MKGSLSYKIFVFSLVILSCSQPPTNYPRNSKISNSSGIPTDSLTFYYPRESFLDTSENMTWADSFYQYWFSTTLYLFKEPVLFNYYLGHDIYRFLWLRSFDKPVLITLTNLGNKIQLTTKQLNKQPELRNQVKYSGDTTIVIKAESIVIKAERKADIEYNSTKELTTKEWEKFENILREINFYNLSTVSNNDGADGSEWVLEAHLKSKYKVVRRWTPSFNIRYAGEYLISLSQITERIY